MNYTYKRFVFESFSFDEAKKKLIFRYSFDSKVFCEETFVFDFEYAKDFSMAAFLNAAQGLWIMAGISYFKAFLPPEIEIKKGSLWTSQISFFQKIYTQGLGEFFYRNERESHEKIHFDLIPHARSLPPAVRIPNLSGNIVLLGGGKDSLTTAEILKKEEEDFETLTVGDFPFFQKMIEKIGKPHLKIRRILDEAKLAEFQKQGALNGHVPISAILAFAGVCAAILRGKENIILSNEHSADEPNIVLESGAKINHQYSKSREFEKDFQAYVHEFISPDVQYFSFLRPLAELKIAEVFCHEFFEKYGKDFSSCNKNFTQKRKNNDSFFWCGTCAKCAFAFLIFSSFLSREKLEKVFGKNLFADPDLFPIFRQLLGQEGIKPFDCVGEINEARWALELTRKRGEFGNIFPGKTFKEFDFSEFFPHSMPQKFENILKKFLEKK